MSETSELERIVRLNQIPAEPLRITASEAERAALARRFGLPAIHSLSAVLAFETDGQAVSVDGKLEAEIDQDCAVSGEPFRNRIAEPVSLRFVPAETGRSAQPDEEIELEADDLDELEYEGESFDVGEAIAQTLGLGIDPYAVGPNAETARRDAGLTDEAASGPFAALAALKKD